MQDVKRRNVTKDRDKKEIINEKSDKLKPKKDETPNRNISLKVLSRTVVIFCLLTIVYFSSNDDRVKNFAKQSEKLPGKGQIVECSQSYMNEVDIYEGCFPKYCKRFVTDMVVSDIEADKLLAIAKKGLKHGGSNGGASILDLHSGAMSKGKYFVNFYKIPELSNVFDESDFNTYRVVKEKIKHSVAHHFGVSPDKMYLTHPTFFSEITSKEAVTVHDEYWHPHVDKETYKSFHYTTLLYLGDYGKDFKGGRFVFIDEKYNRTLEPRKGRVSMFTSGAENLHYVEKVTSGIRYAITVSFTCDKKYAIEDPGETYKSFHYTTLLYLGDYGKDFKGGRFVFIDEKYNRTLEPRKGRVSMFTSGAENLHYVEKVTSGIRYAITVSFTCDKKYAIEDPGVNKYEK